MSNHKRIFFIGNGPSLKEVNLTVLANEYSFACNRIHLHPSYEKGWRPSCWIMVDRSGNEEWKNDFRYHLSQGYSIISTDEIVRDALWDWAGWWNYSLLRIVVRCGHLNARQNPPFRWHPPHLCSFGSPEGIAAQIAVMEMKVEKLIFIGCDGEFQPDYRKNYFAPDYLTGEDLIREDQADLQNANLKAVREVINFECGRLGVQALYLSDMEQIEKELTDAGV